MDLFEYKPEDMISGLTIGGAATWVDAATRCDINLYI
jgi:peroxiredoxin family protein